MHTWFLAFKYYCINIITVCCFWDYQHLSKTSVLRLCQKLRGTCFIFVGQTKSEIVPNLCLARMMLEGIYKLIKNSDLYFNRDFELGSKSLKIFLKNQQNFLAVSSQQKVVSPVSSEYGGQIESSVWNREVLSETFSNLTACLYYFNHQTLLATRIKDCFNIFATMFLI